MGVMATVKAALVASICAFTLNEANAAPSQRGTHATSFLDTNWRAASDLHQLRHHFERSEQERAKSMNSIMQNMTSHSALEILTRNKKASPELIALAQTAVSHTRLRASTSGDRGMPKGLGAAGSAKYMLNSLLEETMKKYDLEILKCRDYYTKQCGMIEEARGSIAASNMKVAQCRTHILGSEAQIGSGEANIPPAKHALTAHRTKCKKDVKAMHEKLKHIQGDIDVMDNILKMTDCGPRSLIQTARHVGHGHRVGHHVGLLHCKQCDGKSLLSFDHSPLRKHIDSLKTHVAQQLLQENFADFAPVPAKNVTPAVKLRRTLVPASPCDDPSKGAPAPRDKRAAKCTLSGHTSCHTLQERFILIQAGLKDGEDDIKDDIVDIEDACEKTQETLSRSVEKAEQTLKQYQTKLAEGTSCENEAGEEGRLSNTEFQEMTEEMHKQKTSCTDNYQQFEQEMCGLKKIRSELYVKMKGMGGKPFFQDCKLSDWSPSECSKDCGGGEQEMSRSIEVQPEGGAKCLPLTQIRRCNEQPCPVDCKLSKWSGWSSCSADCGGGVETRLRDVDRSMKHNGNPCGEVSETKACAVQACESDCELADWTKWAKCSKECDRGTRKRMRHVKIAAAGQGECPDTDSTKRAQFKTCNAHACPILKDKTTVSCDAKIDLILVLDGSGSLGKKGWAATKKAAGMIIGAMDPVKAQVAVLLYSGPNNWAKVNKCFKQSGLDQELVCKMQWVQHFSPDNIKMAMQKVKFLDWPKGSTMTSLALMNALAETQVGRKDAQTVVAVITDGKPLSKKKTWRAAKALRKVARLMWVPVTNFAPLKMIRKMATKRWQENVVLANNFETLGSPKFIDHIIADMCPKVKEDDD